MAGESQDILIDFQVDYSELDGALATLQNFGQIDSKTAQAFKNTSTAVKGVSTDTKGLIQTFNTVKNTATTMGASVKKAFDKGVIDALNEAGVSVGEFAEALKKASKEPQTLKQELLKLTQAIAEAKANGKDLGAEFESMVKRAGNLKDAIADANAEIKNAGSDTRGIDNVIGSLSAVAGGFAVAQGAAAIFGDENENLQKALLKVNAAIAISQGLQQVSNALTKEGSLTKLADATATGFQTAAQKIYTAVTGKATAATKAFKVALASTGILAIVGLVVALADAMDLFGNETKGSTDDLEKFNDELQFSNKLLNTTIQSIENEAQIREQKLIQRGASEKEIHFNTMGYLKQQSNALRESANEQDQNLRKLIANGKISAEAANKIQDDIDAKRIQANDIEQRRTLESEKFKADQIEKIRRDSNKKSGKNAEEEARKARQKLLEDELAAIQLKLLTVEKESQAEVDLLKKEVAKKSEIDLNAAGLTENQIKLIKAKSLDDQLNLQKEFNKKLKEEQIQNLIEVNNASLAQLNLSSEERLQLEIDNINAKAELEIKAAEGNISKLLAIDAQREEDIRNLKKETFEKSLEDEISLNNLRTAAGRRALEQIVNDERKSARERIAALTSITNADINEIDKRIGALMYEHDQKLVSEEEYTKRYLKLIDDRNKAVESLNKQSTTIEKEDREKNLEEIVQRTIEVAQMTSDFFNNLNQLTADLENSRIEGQKRQLQELIEAGAITKKQADIREKEIEIQQNQARQRQAQRDKQLAIFQAIINTAAAVTKALPNLVLAGIVGAFGAAQIALIAARPIPKFAKGKKDRWSGVGQVGEAGQELVERNGRMYLTTKPTIMYLGPTDKVYTHRETKQILHNSDLQVKPSQQGIKIDYDQLGAAVGKELSKIQVGGNVVNIDKNGVVKWTKDKLEIEKWFADTYSFKK